VNNRKRKNERNRKEEIEMKNECRKIKGSINRATKILSQDNRFPVRGPRFEPFE